MAIPPEAIEPRCITHIGGALNGKKMADLGQTRHVLPNGDLYKRVQMDAGNQAGRICFDVLAFFGKTWDEATPDDQGQETQGTSSESSGVPG